jgi:DNA-binding response OmpR family regulator
MKVLVADDDVDLLDITTYALRREGYRVVAAVDGKQALQRWEEESPNLVLLELNLPKLDGLEVCRQIRRVSETPVILLSSRMGEEDVVRGFQSGADDFVAKPFSVRQLHARMQAVLRRAQADGPGQPARALRVGDLALDTDALQVTRGGKVVQLTRLQFRILQLLVLNAGWVVPHERLVDFAWEGEDEDNVKLLKTHVYHIRRKLGMPLDGTSGIKTVPGVGYSLART